MTLHPDSRQSWGFFFSWRISSWSRPNSSSSNSRSKQHHKIPEFASFLRNITLMSLLLLGSIGSISCSGPISSSSNSSSSTRWVSSSSSFGGALAMTTTPSAVMRPRDPVLSPVVISWDWRKPARSQIDRGLQGQFSLVLHLEEGLLPAMA